MLSTTRLRTLTQQFYQATYAQIGIDAAQVIRIFKELHRHRAQAAFAAEVCSYFLKKGYANATPLSVVQDKCIGNDFKRLFKQAQYNELEDYWLKGKNTFRSTPWQYRRQGMWRAVAELVTAIKKYPVISTAIIGLVGYSGHKWPFWGGLSGAAIMVWSLGATLYNELKALAIPKMNAEKAERYIVSGENICGFSITALGADGIYKSLTAGSKAFKQATDAVREAQRASRYWRGVKDAFTVELKETPMGPFEKVRFITGLFDNVLVPFNTAMDWIYKQKRITESHLSSR